MVAFTGGLSTRCKSPPDRQKPMSPQGAKPQRRTLLFSLRLCALARNWFVPEKDTPSKPDSPSTMRMVAFTGGLSTRCESPPGSKNQFLAKAQSRKEETLLFSFAALRLGEKLV